MKLLLIISQYAPAQTPNTLRWIPLLNYFSEKGHDIYVLTTKRKGYTNKETQNETTVYRAGYNTLFDYISDLSQSKSRRNETGRYSYSGKVSFWRQMAEKLVDKTWRKNYWPDGSKLFLKPGIKKATEIIEDNKISHIISVGLPFTPHLIAKTIKEKVPKIQWHMDIQDPFSYSKEFWVNNFTKYQEKNITAEGQAFDVADSISITNHRAAEKYQELFPKSFSKITVIPPLFVSQKNTLEKNLNLYNKKIHLGYFGSFYNGVRSPEPFLKLLNNLNKKDPSLIDKIQIHFFGQQNKFSYPILNAYPEIRRLFILHGFVERDLGLQCMKQMDILINFGNTTDYHLPSKVVDLMFMNKPVVNIISNANDTTATFLKEYDKITNLNLNDINTEKENQFLDFVLQKREKNEPDINKVKDYNIDVIAEAYLKLIL